MQQKIYFTANQQFGRPSAIRDFQRPFENVEDMNLSLEESWNSTVEKDDIVFAVKNLEGNANQKIISEGFELVVLNNKSKTSNGAP